jgi:hypothetical protein
MQPSIGLSGKFDPVWLDFGLFEPRHPTNLVDGPRRPERTPIDARCDGGRVYGVGREQAARIRRRSVRFELFDCDDQHVSGFGAVDEERSRLRIWSGRDAVAVPVHARGVDGLGHDAVTRLDVQRRWMRERVGVVERLWNETVRFGLQANGRPERDEDNDRSGASHVDR